ncbi:hypothetical protein TheetDRAFT_2757 [Thermoanaerobacter ethanolicus JW 200]|nr:hypothetical protein TheetDRAFT_2757 [Thermoanaerobacter ethanolicus JW 200]
MFTQYFGMKFNPFSKEISVNDLYISEDIAELNARLKIFTRNKGYRTYRWGGRFRQIYRIKKIC